MHADRGPVRFHRRAGVLQTVTLRISAGIPLVRMWVLVDHVDDRPAPDLSAALGSRSPPRNGLGSQRGPRPAVGDTPAARQIDVAASDRTRPLRAFGGSRGVTS